MNRVEADKLLQYYEVVDGAPVGAGGAVICALFRPALDEGAFVSQVFWYDADAWWAGAMIGFEATSLAWDSASGTALVLGREGNLARIRADSVIEQSVVGDEFSLGPFRRLRILGDDVLVVGDQRTIYRWQAGRSERLTGTPARPELSATSEEEMVASIIADSELLFDIDGPDADGLLAVGSDGAIWRLQGGSLMRLDSPTNLPLYCIQHGKSELYFAGGRAGLLLKGKESWEEFAVIDGAGDICSIAVYCGLIFACDGQKIYVSSIGEASFEPAKLSDRDVPAHGLRTDGSSLLSVAGKEIFLTSDGAHWGELL